MKKLIKPILAILLFSAFTLNLYADEKVNDEALKKEIPLKYVKYTGEDRSLSSEIEVWLDKHSMNLILTGYQLKDVDIYVLTKDGAVIYQSSYYFGMIPDTYNMEAPSFPGKYYIVIDSPVLYAEGVFEIK